MNDDDAAEQKGVGSERCFFEVGTFDGGERLASSQWYLPTTSCNMHVVAEDEAAAYGVGIQYSTVFSVDGLLLFLR